MTLRAQSMNGPYACLPPFWQDQFNTPLSAIRSFHIEEGFPDPLVNCLHLQRVVRGIKRIQGSSQVQRLPITDEILLIIFNSLDLSLPDH